MTSLRVRFFDDWRLSRIDEEVERLSINSDTSVAVESTSSIVPSPLQPDQRSASADGGLQPDDDDDDDLPLPPPPLTPPPQPSPPSPPTKKTELPDFGPEDEQLRRLHEETEAVRFLQVKYDSLGKMKIEWQQQQQQQQQLAATSAETERATAAADSQCRLTCDCSLASAGNQRPRAAFDGDAVQSAGVTRPAERRPPPPPPTSSARSKHCCATAAAPGATAVERCRLHAAAQHRPHHDEVDQRQRCSHGAATDVPLAAQQQTAHHRGAHDPRRDAANAFCRCSQHVEQRGDGRSGADTERRCPTLLSNAELFQIDLFYRSRRTLVYVSQSPAVLYVSRAAGSGGGGVVASPGWRPAAAGVPVVVIDTVRGGTSSGARLHVVLAERGTGFELWRAGFSSLQQYSVSGTVTSNSDGSSPAAFHTVRLPSGDVAGLCFDDEQSAAEFQRQLTRLGEPYSVDGGSGTRGKKGKKQTSRTRRDETLQGVVISGSRQTGRKTSRLHVVGKADISQPCCFTHVTRLERGTSRTAATAAALLDQSSSSSLSTAAAPHSAVRQANNPPASSRSRHSHL